MDSWWDSSDSRSRRKEPAISKSTLMGCYYLDIFRSPKRWGWSSWKFGWSFPDDSILVNVTNILIDLVWVGVSLSVPPKGRVVGLELWIFKFTVGIKMVFDIWTVKSMLVVCPDSVEVGITSFTDISRAGNQEIIDTFNWHSSVQDHIILWHLNEISWSLSWGLWSSC